jgi:hypothetical protein
MTDFGDATCILGVHITRDLPASIARMSQEQYPTELIKEYGMLDSNPSTLPMSLTHYRDVESAYPSDQVPLLQSDHETFRAILGSVNFLCMCTRHDIGLAINVTSNTQNVPLQIHVKELKRLLHYLNGTRTSGITYGSCAPHLRTIMIVFSNSDWAADTVTRRSQ